MSGRDIDRNAAGGKDPTADMDVGALSPEAVATAAVLSKAAAAEAAGFPFGVEPAQFLAALERLAEPEDAA